MREIKKEELSPLTNLKVAVNENSVDKSRIKTTEMDNTKETFAANDAHIQITWLEEQINQNSTRAEAQVLYLKERADSLEKMFEEKLKEF